jgi:hypothetical protein
MDTQIVNYTFDKVSKSITFTDFASIDLKRVRLIVNVTSNVVLYNFPVNGHGGTVVGNTLTLDHDTSLMNNNDDLQIIYNTEDLAASQVKQDEATATLGFLKRIVNLLESSGVVDIQGRQRVQLDQTVSVIPSYNAIANVPTSGAPFLNNMNWVYHMPTWAGPIDPRWEHFDNAQMVYNTGIRSKLSITP